MRTKLPPVLALVSLFAASAITSLQAQITNGTILYQTNFTGTNGATPDDWDGVTGGSNTMTIQSDRYVFRRVDSGNAMFSWYEGDYVLPDTSLLPASEWTDYRIDTVLRSSHLANTSTRNGLILRWQDDTGPGTGNQGYHGMLSYVNSTTITLSILKDFTVTSGTPGGNGDGTLLESDNFTFSLSDNTDYRLSFEGAGSLLTLTLSDMDETISHSISITDTSYTQGNPGLRVYQSSNTRTTSFDSLTVTAVPEPSTVLLALVAGGLLLMRRIRMLPVRR